MKINRIITKSSFNPGFGANFTELEMRLMKEVIEYSNKHGVETCRFIKHGKDISNQFTLTENLRTCAGYLTRTDRFLGIDVKKLGKIGKYIKMLRNRLVLINSTLIHTHLREMSFSIADIKYGLLLRRKKDIVVTSSGKYAVIEYESSKRKNGLEQLKLWDKWFEKHLPLYEGLKKEDYYKVTQKVLRQFLDDYFNSTGIKYESNIEWTP